ncbi:MAG: isoleucine--tRNA ligase [Bacilli bacterium]|nr:isoleucine--tRNA ligase [Bacilli bacterium]
MEKFKELSKESVDVAESKMIDYWKKHKVFQKSIDNRDIKNTFVFYDGPATANGHPGLHHMVAKFLKDTFTKYHVMKGERVVRKVGWDTHGLPVELEVEKELGFKNKGDIEKYGIEPFNAKCKESVRRNEKTFTELTDKMGQFIDTDNPYVTYDNNYIETEWWILKKFFDEGLFYEGSKILPFCTRCGTGLASHEVAQGYEEIEVETVIVPMKLKDRDAYFLVWTTTPWTLLANVALCVNPKYDYVEVESKGYKFILCKTLVHQVLGDEVKVLKEYKGTDLEGLEYDQLLPFLETKKKGFFVCCDEYVTDSDGTGIVHIAPAFGADDAEVGKKYNLPYLNPVGEDGCYTEGPWKGMYIFDADKEVIKWLKENDKLFRKQKMVHNYPHCWRCHTPLLYYSKPSYYLEITKIKDKIVEANKTVNWFPSYVGEKRFGNWLEELKDWALSRQRYWGTPLPLWICDCGHEEMIGSREELAEKAIEKVDPKTIDLHRPFVDDIHLKCPKCGGKMSRTTDVIDCWFDSGAMPFSQYHYPFENKELWENQFPADFICEGIDQTRGWFYSLMVISVFVTGKSPYKNVLVNDLLLDKDGKKMSKSKGNIVEPFTTMKTYGADGVRWYLPYVSPVWTPLKFDVEGIKEVNSKFFNTLKNTYAFFQMYANTDEVDPRTFEVDYKDLEDIDKWLLSKYNNLVKDVTEVMNQYDVNKAVHLIQYFVCEELSNWYIRRNRRRFWGSKLDTSKKAVYKTTYDVLVGLCKLIAPISPFLSDEIYINLTGEESVHLTDYPVYDKKLINEKLEEKMDLVIELISITRNIREEAKIKVRQPISEVIFEDKYKSTIKEFEALICEELNAKSVVWAKDMGEYLNVEYKPNFKEVGKTLGSNISKLQEYLKNISEEDAKLLEAGELKLDLGGITHTIDNTYVIKYITAKEGYAAVMINYKKVAINTTLTQDLINEGIAREIVSKIQNLRKTSNFDIADRIEVKYSADKEVKDALKQFKKYVMDEILAVKLEESEDAKEELKINDYTMKVSLKQVK